MAIFKLFVVVLTFSCWGGRALECAYKEESEEFCRRVNESYQLNNSSQHLLTGDTFREDRERISVTNLKVLDLLKLKEKSKLEKALCSALDWETNAVFNVGVSCSGSQKGTQACLVGITPLCLATEELVNATVEIIEEDKKSKILKASSEYHQKGNKTDKVTWAWQANDFGRTVMTILNC